jgi:ribosomal protein L37AE/L43A
MYFIGKKRCPACGIKVKIWKKQLNVYICPGCKAFFNEFGIILESQDRREDVFT